MLKNSMLLVNYSDSFLFVGEANAGKLKDYGATALTKVILCPAKNLAYPC